MAYPYKKEVLNDDDVNKVIVVCNEFEEKLAIFNLLGIASG